MKKKVALIYAYFSLKKLPTPYFRTIMVITGFIVMLLFLLYTLLPIPKYLSPFGMNKEPIKNYIYGGLFIGMLYFIISFVFKKKYLEQYSFTEKQIKNSVWYMLSYFLILFLLIFIFSILHIRNKW